MASSQGTKTGEDDRQDFVVHPLDKGSGGAAQGELPCHGGEAVLEEGRKRRLGLDQVAQGLVRPFVANLLKSVDNVVGLDEHAVGFHAAAPCCAFKFRLFSPNRGLIASSGCFPRNTFPV